MPVILAFDQSIKRTGWAIHQPRNLRAILSGSFTSAPRDHMDTEEKGEIFGGAIKDLFDKHQPDFVVWEAAKEHIVAYPRKQKTSGKATRTKTGDMFAAQQDKTTAKMMPASVNAGQLILRDIQGQIRQACIERGLPWVKVAPTTWRAAMYGEGRGTMETEAAKKYAVAQCQMLRLSVRNADEAEAVMIAMWAETCEHFRHMMQARAA